MNIGILGSGSVGGTLGVRWAQAGHTVLFGSRNPHDDKITSLVARSNHHGHAATFQHALAESDIVVLATPWNATRDLISQISGWDNKIVIDATNRLFQTPAPDSVGSSAQDVAAWTGSRVVRAFNSVGADIMRDPVFDADHAVMLYCGDDADAKATVRTLIADLGFDPCDIGGLSMAATLDHMTMLWVNLARSGFGRDFAFKLLKR